MQRSTSQFPYIMLILALIAMLSHTVVAQTARTTGENFLSEYAKALNSNDPEKIAAFYAEDAINYYKGGGEVHGRESIKQDDIDFFTHTDMKVELKGIQFIQLADDYVFQRGMSKGTTTQKTTSIAFDWETEFVQLLKEEGGKWKSVRTVWFERNNSPRTVRKAKIYSVKDKDAFRVARDFDAKRSTAWSTKDKDIFVSIKADDMEYHDRYGDSTAGGPANIADFVKWTGKYDYAMSGRPVDAVQVSKDRVYYMGTWEGNWRNRESGITGAMNTGEFVSILKKEENNWKEAFGIDFFRGRSEKSEILGKRVVGEWISAINNGDAEKLANILISDAVQLSSTGANSYGKTAIVERMQKAFEKSTYKETVTVTDAIRLASDALYVAGSYDLAVTSKADGKVATNKGNYSVLLKKEGEAWKFKRIIGYKYGAASRNLLSVRAYLLPEKNREAMAIAREKAAQTAFAYVNGVYSSSTWAKSAKMVQLDGLVTSPTAITDKIYQDDFAQNRYNLAIRPIEAFFINENMLYTYSNWEASVMDKKTGEMTYPYPGEFLQILKKEEGAWKLIRGVTFRRGLPSQNNR